jgi:hypothetical protein
MLVVAKKALFPTVMEPVVRVDTVPDVFSKIPRVSMVNDEQVRLWPFESRDI